MENAELINFKHDIKRQRWAEFYNVKLLFNC